MFSYLFTYCSISLYTSWKKMIGGYSPSQKSAILTGSVFALCLTVIFPGSRSQLFLLPFYLCYTAANFAQYLLVCPALFRFATDRVYLVSYHYYHQSFLIHWDYQKPEEEFITLTHFRGFYPFLQTERCLRTAFFHSVCSLHLHIFFSEIQIQNVTQHQCIINAIIPSRIWLSPSSGPASILTHSKLFAMEPHLFQVWEVK